MHAGIACLATVYSSVRIRVNLVPPYKIVCCAWVVEMDSSVTALQTQLLDVQHDASALHATILTNTKLQFQRQLQMLSFSLVYARMRSEL